MIDILSLAPSGNTSALSAVCTAPVPSVARARSVCAPGLAVQSKTHCRHVSAEYAADKRAGRHSPSST